jgi:hypothetical protein
MHCKLEARWQASQAEAVYNHSVATQIHLRSRTDVQRLFDGYELVEPGLV